MTRPNKTRVGGWLPSNPEILQKWIAGLLAKPLADASNYIQPIQELQNLVANTPSLQESTQTMFIEGYDFDPANPLGTPSVTSWPQFLGLLNAIMTTAPQFYTDKDGGASGLVGFPINALLDWPMGTRAGYATFSSELFNRQMKKVLNCWGEFLTTGASRYVLAEGDPSGDPPTIAWLSEQAKQQ